MPEDLDRVLLRRLIGGLPEAVDAVLDRPPASTAVPLMVAAALVRKDPDLLSRAAAHAITTRDRQLVALADARLHGDADLLDVLVREHLAEHPDSLLAAWIAGLPAQN
jgi:hypothetical protein